MDEVTKEIAERYVRSDQIEQLGPQPPELLDAVLRGNILIIILVDGRKLTFNTSEAVLWTDEQPAEETRPRSQRKVSEPFTYIEEAIEEETKSRKGRKK